MEFSILIPVYNVEKYLNECLDSILCQIKDDACCEILLIDDGSTDNSGKICDEYKNKYPTLIKVFHKQNEGLLLTRRYGYKKASGKYIINCDSDDLLENNYFEEVRRVIKKYKEPDMILYNYCSFDGRNKNLVYENVFSNDADIKVPKKEILKEFLLHHNIVSVCAKALKKECIDIEKDYKDFACVSNGEDSLQSIEFFNYANSFVYLNKALYDYRAGSGMTNKFDPNYFQSFKAVLKLIALQKNNWNLDDFDELFSIKVLQTAGRAITQSRYKNWGSYKEQKKYLKEIKNDSLLQQNLIYLNDVKYSIQKSHYVCLKLLKNDMFFILIILLRVRSIV